MYVIRTVERSENSGGIGSSEMGMLYFSSWLEYIGLPKSGPLTPGSYGPAW